MIIISSSFNPGWCMVDCASQCAWYLTDIDRAVVPAGRSRRVCIGCEDDDNDDGGPEVAIDLKSMLMPGQ